MYEDVNAKCPYFVCANDRTIRCEGLFDGSNTEVLFNKVCKMTKHRYNFCDSDCWKGCPIAQTIDQKYKE